MKKHNRKLAKRMIRQKQKKIMCQAEHEQGGENCGSCGYRDRQAVLDAIWPVDPENDGSDGCTVVFKNCIFSSEEIEAMVDDIPAADVRTVVHAHWKIREIRYGHRVATCSSCGMNSSENVQTFHEQGADFTAHDPILTKFCPNCGADMKGESEQ